jgi:hypothetical protein
MVVFSSKLVLSVAGYLMSLVLGHFVPREGPPVKIGKRSLLIFWTVALIAMLPVPATLNALETSHSAVLDKKRPICRRIVGQSQRQRPRRSSCRPDGI